MATRSTQSAYDIEMFRAERDSARAELAALRQRVTELEYAQSIVTPNNCPSCTWRGEVELSGGVCPQCGINWKSIVTPNNCPHCQRSAEQVRSLVVKLIDDAFSGDARKQSKQDTAAFIIKLVYALPLPACDGCNPLAPTVDYTHVKPQSQAALRDQLDELVKIANINGLYDAADFVANRK